MHSLHITLGHRAMQTILQHAIDPLVIYRSSWGSQDWLKSTDFWAKVVDFSQFLANGENGEICNSRFLEMQCC
jgi:hypothetical protein